MPSRSSRASGALLDPYGIYGTRTANRLRASRRRRQTQNVLLVLCIVALFVSAFAMIKWRRVETDYADAIFETGVSVGGSPIWVSAQNGAKGTLLVASRDGRLIRIDDGTNASEGTPQKSVLLETDFPLHEPLIARDKIFVPSEDGVLSAVSWKDKRLFWRVRFDDSLTARPTSFSLERKLPPPVAPQAPPATNTVLPANASPAPAPSTPARQSAQQSTRRHVVVAGSDAGLLMAIDAGSGKPLWRVRLPAPIGNGLDSVEANGRARVLVPLLGGAGMRGGLWCLDGATGKVLWRFPKDVRAEAIQFTPPIGDLSSNRAYGASDLGAIVSLNLTTGTYDSKKRIGWKKFARPLRSKDDSQTILLRATPLLMELSRVENGAKASNKILLVGGNDGGVRCLSAVDGTLLWQYKMGAPVLSLAPVRQPDGSDLVLAVSRGAQLVMLDPISGAVARRLSGRNATFTGATVADGYIFAVTESGTIHRFSLSN